MSRLSKVWDAPTRLFHWSMLALFAALWASGEQGGDWLGWHLLLGKLMLVLVLFRVLWGLVGSQTSRFSDFLAGPARIGAYLRGEATPSGHNPLGGWMVLALLLALLLQAGLGLFAADVDSYLYDGPLKVLIDSDRAEWITGLHKAWFDVLLALAGVHVLAVMLYKLVRKIDLVRPMLTGVKALPEHAAPLRFAPWWLAPLVLALVATLVFAGLPWLAGTAAG